ncbi:Endonuclease/exonuclease/phosphatase [Artemisia annua]|uniref:Endonuclease/exonuclease/phosphatase n=1 Tax=Artemisia annua TaxID=35608 RepID=A0A2U1NNC5_ARTAN|nr:Endonuclease/exonuclease/phosphatase [Artemisia annua]
MDHHPWSGLHHLTLRFRLDDEENVPTPMLRVETVPDLCIVVPTMSINRGNDVMLLNFCLSNSYETGDVTTDTILPMGGRRFTRIDKSCSKMAKLDRFLVSNRLTECLYQMVGMVLPRLWSDHCPIVLKHEARDYGPIPFKLFNSWSMHEGYEQVVRDAWNTT